MGEGGILMRRRFMVMIIAILLISVAGYFLKCYTAIKIEKLFIFLKLTI